MLPCHREIQRTLLRFASEQSRLLTVATFQRGRERPHVQPAFDLRLIIAMTGETLLMKERRDATDKKLLGVSSRKGRRRRDPEHGNQKPKHTEAGAVPRRQAGLSELHQSYSRLRSGECQK